MGARVPEKAAAKRPAGRTRHLVDVNGVTQPWLLRMPDAEIAFASGRNLPFMTAIRNEIFRRVAG
jgi:hypothetical protein